MKRYTMSAAAADAHTPQHPERTARRNQASSLDFDVTFQVWPSREAMARSIRMQEQRASKQTDWRACQQLSPGEGY